MQKQLEYVNNLLIKKDEMIVKKCKEKGTGTKKTCNEEI